MATLEQQLEASVAVAQAAKSSDNPVGLNQKLLAIMRDVAYIQKDKANTFHNYRYASEATIKSALHAALVKYGVLFQCDPVAILDQRPVLKSDKTSGSVQPGIEVAYMFQFHYVFTDAVTGETREGTAIGAGADSADKAIYKSWTGAIKYILTSTFLIPTGDDPEDNQQTKEEKKAAAKAIAERKIAEMGGPRQVDKPNRNVIINDGQRKRLYAISRESGKPHDVVKIILKEWGFNSSTEITADKYDGIVDQIRKPLKLVELANGQDWPDPLEIPNDAYVLCGGKLYRVNDDNTAFEEMK